MAKVVLSPDRQSSKDIDRALRQLKKIMENEGVFKKLREKQCFERPGAKRIRKRAAAIMRWKREVEKDVLPTRRR